MDRDVFDAKTTISYLVSKAIEGSLSDYEDKVLKNLSVLACSLLRQERDLSNVTFHICYECKK